MLFNENETQTILRAADLLSQHLKAGMTITSLAREVNMSEKKLKAGFMAIHKIGVYGYLRKERIKKAKEYLIGGASVKQTGKEVGYKSESAFVKAFREMEGETPLVWLKGKRTFLVVA